MLQVNGSTYIFLLQEELHEKQTNAKCFSLDYLSNIFLSQKQSREINYRKFPLTHS